jgi:long-subunit acyl-CoA synthetase (AMP-forming)
LFTEPAARRYSVMRGYWGEPERTAEAIDAAGRMRTGDLARRITPDSGAIATENPTSPGPSPSVT